MIVNNHLSLDITSLRKCSRLYSVLLTIAFVHCVYFCYFHMQTGSYCERLKRNARPAYGALELQLNKELDVFVANYQKVFMKENETEGKFYCRHGPFTKHFQAL